jgi:hypothetical protein
MGCIRKQPATDEKGAPMEDSSHDHLQILGQLALEYEQKQKELQKIIQDADPDRILQQLVFRAELTTDHFRSAQRVLLTLLCATDENRKDEVKKAAIALCRCFDEMRILFQSLADRSYKIQK